MQPEVLFEPPLDPISRASVPGFLADRESQPCHSQRVPEHPDMKVRRPVMDAMFHDPLIIRGSANPVLFGQPEATFLRLTGACVLLLFSARGPVYHSSSSSGCGIREFVCERRCEVDMFFSRLFLDLLIKTLKRLSNQMWRRKSRPFSTRSIRDYQRRWTRPCRTRAAMV
jgi:hypothetical protein